MLFQGSSAVETNDYDVDVLMALAIHAERERGFSGWQLFCLMEVKDTLLVATMPDDGLRPPIDMVMRGMDAMVSSNLAKMSAGELGLNPAVQKYCIGMGVLYKAGIVREGDPQAEALLHEHEVMGHVSIDPDTTPHVHAEHMLLRHMNGLMYTYMQKPDREWDEDFPQVRVDDARNPTFGDMGLGLNALVAALTKHGVKKPEVRCG